RRAGLFPRRIVVARARGLRGRPEPQGDDRGEPGRRADSHRHLSRDGPLVRGGRPDHPAPSRRNPGAGRGARRRAGGPPPEEPAMNSRKERPMADATAEKIAARLEGAVDAIERSLERTRRTVGRAAAELSDESRSAIESEWIALKKDLSDLMNRSDLAESPEVKAVIERLRGTIGSMSDSVVSAASEARYRARESADRVNEQVHASPWQAAGIAAVARFVIGVLLSRRSQEHTSELQ